MKESKILGPDSSLTELRVTRLRFADVSGLYIGPDTGRLVEMFCGFCRCKRITGQYCKLGPSWFNHTKINNIIDLFTGLLPTNNDAGFVFCVWYSQVKCRDQAYLLPQNWALQC
jgi:hypothetical protein